MRGEGILSISHEKTEDYSENLAFGRRGHPLRYFSRKFKPARARWREREKPLGGRLTWREDAKWERGGNARLNLAFACLVERNMRNTLSGKIKTRGISAANLRRLVGESFRLFSLFLPVAKNEKRNSRRERSASTNTMSLSEFPFILSRTARAHERIRHVTSGETLSRKHFRQIDPDWYY